MTEPSNYCIELVKCVDATLEERKAPNYIPQLQINKEAQHIISTQFRSPISVIVYVGEMGVGKSKLATVTVNTFYSQRPQPPLRPFRSGAGVQGVTQGIWMWADPLPHPSGEGSVLLLDCEGMGDIDENVGANLYLFCMLISTSFAVLLRPARIQKSQSDRLYHALLRFKNMKTHNILPNLWLIPLETSNFIQTDPYGIKDDQVITKDEWLKQIFVSIDPNSNKRSAVNDVETQQQHYDFINEMLPNKNACKVYDIPKTLKGEDRQNIDIWALLHTTNDKDTKDYLKSILKLITQLLSTGGKVLPGSSNKTLYIRPAEFSSLMSDLIEKINEDKVPNPDSLLDRYLRARFTNEVVKEQMAKYESDLFNYVESKLCPIICDRQRPETIDEQKITNQELFNEKKKLIKFYVRNIIRLARFQIFGLDEELCDEFKNNDDEACALNQLPKSIRNELKHIEETMVDYQKSEQLLGQNRSNMTIADARRREEASKKLAQLAVIEAENHRLAADKERKITEAFQVEKVKALEGKLRAELDQKRAMEKAEAHRKAAIQAEEGREKAEAAREEYEKKAANQRKRYEQEEADMKKKTKQADDDIKKYQEEANEQRRINEIVKSNQWVVEREPCKNCGHAPKAHGIVHAKENCSSGRVGNWYYFDRSKNEMVCDACRKTKICDPREVLCGSCKKSVEVIRVL